MTNLIKDNREIESAWASDAEDGFYAAVGRLMYYDAIAGEAQNIQHIVCYAESGSMGPVPWVAVYCNDEIVQRFCVLHGGVTYKRNEEKQDD